MKINITKKEYKALLEMIEMAGWVLFAHQTEERPETEKYRNLEQKFLSYAKDMRAKNLVAYDSKAEKHVVTAEFEEISDFMHYIEKYNNDTFWDELIERLSYRDLLRQEGEDSVRQMTITERYQKVAPIREKYFREFQANGINAIYI